MFGAGHCQDTYQAPAQRTGRSLAIISWCLLICTEIQGDTKKRELLKNPTKMEEIQEKKN